MSFSSTRRFRTTNQFQSIYKKKPNSYRTILKNRNNNQINHQKTQQLKNQIRNSEINEMSRSLTDIGYKSQKNREYDSIRNFVKKMNPKPQQKQSIKDLCESTRSFYKKKSMSGLVNKDVNKSSRSNKSQLSLELIQQLSLVELQKKVDDLIELKLKYPNKSLQIDQQITKIIIHFRQNLSNCQLQVEQNLQDIGKKIMILQKLMAQSLAESQVLKKNFYTKVTSRNNRFIQRQYVKSSNLLKKSLNQYKKIGNSNSQSRIMSGSLQKQSLAQSSYKVPNKTAYNTFKSKKPYQYRYQSLPRSTYSRQFLTYASKPQLSYKQYDNNILTSNQKMRINSTYKHQFTNKKTEPINFKQLDCFQDKLKNLKVSFMDIKSEALNMQKSKNLKKLSQNLQKYSSHKKSSFDKNHIKTEGNQVHYPKQLNSESRHNFKGSKPIINSIIKHKNLNTLKYGYRKSAKA